jgi:hypothetical protein
MVFETPLHAGQCLDQVIIQNIGGFVDDPIWQCPSDKAWNLSWNCTAYPPSGNPDTLLVTLKLAMVQIYQFDHLPVNGKAQVACFYDLIGGGGTTVLGSISPLSINITADNKNWKMLHNNQFPFNSYLSCRVQSDPKDCQW